MLLRLLQTSPFFSPHVERFSSCQSRSALASGLLPQSCYQHTSKTARVDKWVQRPPAVCVCVFALFAHVLSITPGISVSLRCCHQRGTNGESNISSNERGQFSDQRKFWNSKLKKKKTKDILRDKKGVRHAGRPSNVFCNASLSPQALSFSPLTSRQKVLCQVLSDHTDVVGGFISLLRFKLLCFSGRGSV